MTTGDPIRDTIARVNARYPAEEPEPEVTAEPEPTPAAPVGVGSAQPVAVGVPVELGELVGGGAPPIAGEGVYNGVRRREVVDKAFRDGVTQEPFQGVYRAGGWA
uniref:hypothetical protein n=1 Tax=Gordonia sp. B7-2 TaxID=3420932 RepID=UPI003D8A7628